MKFLEIKSDQNIHQNAPNCTILKKFLRGACPRTPLAKRMANFQIWKKNSWPPPLPNPGDAPGNSNTLSTLINSYCMLVYGCHLWKFNGKHINTFLLHGEKQYE